MCPVQHPAASSRADHRAFQNKMAEFGKILVFFGVLLLVLGALFLLLGRTGLPVGRLPGDILYRGKNTTFYFPFTTSILLSAVLSLVLYVIGRLRH